MTELRAENRRLRRDLHFARCQREILKDAGHPGQSERQRFERMKANPPGTSCCAALDVTRSGYPTWAQHGPGQRAQADAELLPLLRAGHAAGRGNYGRLRVLAWLVPRGVRCGRPRARLLRQTGLSQRRRLQAPEPDRQRP